MVEISLEKSMPLKPFNSLFNLGFPFPYREFKAIKDNDPEIIRANAPLNHKAGVKCSYVYIVLKKTFKN